MWQKLLHKWLKAPYILHTAHYQAPKQYAATVILLHGIGSSTAMWDNTASKLPAHSRVIALDLLGFGKSPKPAWNTYSARIQADSIATTLFAMRITGPVIIAGHSLGALVAIEFARRYPIMTRELILVSPPLYDIDREPKSTIVYHPRRMLQNVHAVISSHPDSLAKLFVLASQYKLVNQGFDVSRIDLPTFLGTLETAIINQTSMRDLIRLKKPTTIITGKLDPFINESTVRRLAKEYPSITWSSVIAGHEIKGLLESKVVKTIERSIANMKPTRVLTQAQ